jgi:5-methylcytosine-specific restriction endonuclease McrA
MPIPRHIYLKYMYSWRWYRKRTKRKKLDNNQCQHCGSAENLTVHHVTYDRFENERMSDLLTLCQACHYAVHHPNHQTATA